MKKKLAWTIVVFLSIALAIYIATHSRKKTVYPDPGLTPGVTDPDATTEKICSPGYTASVRAVPVKIRKSVFKEYGLEYPPPFGEYEIDHFIPLELGGSNDIKNLWPEPADPHPGFHQKDLVENYLHRKVCAREITLQEAQNEIKKDWYAVYLKIPN